MKESDSSSSSRSTSVGRSPPAGSDWEADVTTSPASVCGPDGCAAAETGTDASDSETESVVPGLPLSRVPDFDYSATLSVRNTFIHAGPIGRGPSLDGFFREREVRSCPGSGICAAPGPEVGPEETPGCSPVPSCEELIAAAAAALTQMETKAAPWPTSIPPPPAGPPALAVDVSLPMPPPPPAVSATQEEQTRPFPSGHAISLAEALPQPPVLGSPELPTVGSQGHHLNNCSPCAHAHAKRPCINGLQCSFCHLCPPGELKRRQRMKRLAKRALAGEAVPAES